MDAESEVDSAAFLTLSDNLKVANGQLKAIMTACERSKVEAKQHSTAGMFFGSDQIADAIFSYSLDIHFSKKSPALASALVAYGTIQRKLSLLRKELDQKIKERFLKPINLFIDNDMKRAQTTRHQYDHQKKTFEAVKSKLKESEFKLDPHKHYSLQLDYVTEKQEFENVHAKSIAEVTDLDKLKDIELITRLKALMGAHLEYLQQSMQVFDKVEGILAELDEARAKETATLVEKRKEWEKAATLKRQQQLVNKYNPLVELISTNTCLSTLFEQPEASSPSEEILISVARVLDHKKILLPIIKAEITKSISENTDPQVLFRANTLVTRLTSALTTITGAPYIQAALGEVMRKLSESSEEFEIDPAHVGDPSVLEQNFSRLTNTTECILQSILNSTDSFPLPFRYLCAHLRKEATTKFNERIGNIAIGGFIFLRFFCPHILNPTKLGLLQKPPPKNVFRALVLITKSLQSLANNAEFSASEEYMKVMDDFIKANRKLVVEWYDKLVVLPEDFEQGYTPIVSSRQELETRDLPMIEDVCRTYLRKVSKVPQDEKPFFIKFCRVMATLERINVPLAAVEMTTPTPSTKPPPLRHLLHISTDFIQQKIADYSSNSPLTARPTLQRTLSQSEPVSDNITSSGLLLANCRRESAASPSNSSPSLTVPSLSRQQFGTVRSHNISPASEKDASPPPIRRGENADTSRASHTHRQSSDQSDTSPTPPPSSPTTPHFESSVPTEEFHHIKDGASATSSDNLGKESASAKESSHKESSLHHQHSDTPGKRKRSGSSGVESLPPTALAVMSNAMNIIEAGEGCDTPALEKTEIERASSDCLSDGDGSGLSRSEGSVDGTSMSTVSEMDIREREEKSNRTPLGDFTVRISPETETTHIHRHHHHHKTRPLAEEREPEQVEKTTTTKEESSLRRHHRRHADSADRVGGTESGSSDESRSATSPNLPLQMCPPLRKERKALSVLGLFNNNQQLSPTPTQTSPPPSLPPPLTLTTAASSENNYRDMSPPPPSSNPPPRSLTSPYLLCANNTNPRYPTDSSSQRTSPGTIRYTKPEALSSYASSGYSSNISITTTPTASHSSGARETRRRSASTAVQLLPSYLSKL
ncbi:GTPaseactivator protein [Pelomyxa schiedti]|nr:GTPaseactivator protein [Pelomyxa schiedti]